MTFTADPKFLRGVASLTVVTCCSVSTLVLASSATAVPTVSPAAAPARLTGQVAAAGTPTAPGSEGAASAQAQSSGTATVVDDLTTPTSQTTANPDGSFTRVESLLPTRVEQGGTWVPVNTSLRAGSDGMVHPTASPTDVAFSGGGTGPLIRVVADGKPLTITYPRPLPAPVISANTATYSEVMPGVDLVVTATAGGGFSEVLTVKTPAAAANPDLDSVDFMVSAAGLNIAADPVTGALQGSDSSGLQFTAPTPLMWDSTTVDATGSPVPPGTTPDASDGSTPGEQAQTSIIDADPGTKSQSGGMTTQTLSVQPDRGMFTDPDTEYPVYIDPVFATASPKARQAFTWVQSGCPTTSNYNSQNYDPGVGYNNFSGCKGIERAYYRLDTSGLSGVYVNTATLKTSVTYSAKFCPAPAYSVKAAYADDFGSGTTWNNRPGAVAAPEDDSDTVSVTHCQGQAAVAVNFDVTKSVKRAARDNIASSTYALSGNEGDEEAFKRFGDNPTLSITYDKPPNPPTNLTMNPAPVNGWVGATNAATPIDLSATLSSPITGQVLHGVFTLTDTSNNTKPLNGVSSGDVGNGGTAHRATPTLTNGHDYVWSVYASDGLLTSSTVSGPAFSVDATPPTMGSVTSADYPASGSTTLTTKHAGDLGSFTLNATDDNSGVARIDWQLNTALPAGSIPASTSVSGSKSFTGTLLSASATVNVTPGRWGTNVLFTRVVDKAGNTSQTKQYYFYVPSDPTDTPTLGDIDGDHSPDVITITTDGRLRVYPANSDPAVVVPNNTTINTGPYIASDAKEGLGGSWTGSILTHRGSFTANRSVDDLFVWKNNTMYIYTNNVDQRGHYFSQDNTFVDHPTCTCTGHPDGWNSLTGMVATGDLTGDGRNDLITIEDKRLWLNYGVAAKGLGDAIELTLTLPGGASVDLVHATLVAPGDVNHDGNADLWIRDRVTGTITQFNGTGTAAGLSTSGTTVGTGYTADAQPTVFSGGDFLHDTTNPANYVPSLVALTGTGSLQLRETPSSAPSTITTATFGSTITAVENQIIEPTHNVYVPVAQSRLVDTRSNQDGGTINPGIKHSWPVVGLSGLPTSGVTAVNINVIGIGTSTNDSWIRFGDNGPAIATSTLDTIANQPVSSSEIVVPDAQGNISAYVGGSGAADVVIDIVGYYTDKADTNSVSGSYAVPLTSTTRFCDSRGTTNLAPGCGTVPTTGARVITMAGYGGIPTNATAVIANFIAPGPTTPTSMVAWPSNLTRPSTTSIYAMAGQNTSSTSTVQLSPTGQLSLSSSAGTQNIIIDVQGYYVPTSAGTPTGATTYVPVPPTRAFYSDDPAMSGTSATPLASVATRSISITGTRDTLGRAIIPPTGACAVAIHIAALKGTTLGHLTLTPQGTTSTSGTLNYPATKARENFAVIKLSASGAIDVYNGGGNPTDYYIDIVGYFTPVSGAC